MNPRLLKRFLSALGAVALVSGCDLDSKVVQSDDRSAGGSDEIDTRIAVDRTGSPVVGARVALVKAGDSSGTALAVSATGSDGAYPTFVVPDGYYSLLVRDSSGVTGRYVDSVRVVSRKLPTGRDTLLSLGSVSGVVRLLSGDSPTSVRLGLVGTDILSSAKSDGTFKIDLVPGGLYTLGAESSLDRYDRIYKRIQIKDGQNLVLSDTLVLPFTGLPAPTGLQVSQDTVTGNVLVKWNVVRSPDLLGYVLERVEGGAVNYSQFLTETTWTDSLGAYWERLPLLGPWPDRSVTYRVRARSASGEADTKSTAQQFEAKAPGWTAAIHALSDSVHYDSVANVIRVKVSHPTHPDVQVWSMERISNGVADCSSPVVGGSWTDSGCKDLRTEVVLKESISSIRIKSVRSRPDVRVGFQVVANRKKSYSETFILSDTILEKALGAPILEWRDSGDVSNLGVSKMAQIGDWIKLWTNDGDELMSKNGVHWIQVPKTGNQPMMAAWGDSLWYSSRTNSTLILGRRSIEFDWSWDTITSDKVPLIDGIVGGPDGLQGYKRYPKGPDNISFFSLNQGQIREVPTPYRLQNADIGGGYTLIPIGSDSLVAVGIVKYSEKSYPGTAWNVVSNEIVTDSSYAFWGDRGNLFAGVFPNPALLFWATTVDALGNMQINLGIQTVSGITWAVPGLHGRTWTGSEPTTVFRGEALTIIDGHLWKGKLNLPK